MLRKPKTPETALSPIMVSCHPFFLLISVLIHGTALQAVIIHIQNYSTRSLQLNAGDPTTATSHIAHDERHLTQVGNGFKKVLQPMWELFTMFGCQTPLFLAQGRSSTREMALFSKVVRLLSFFLSLSVLIPETAPQDIHLRHFPSRFHSTV